MMRILERIVLVGIFLLAIVIGVGVAAIVIEAVDHTHQTACFDYKTPEACEGERKEQILWEEQVEFKSKGVK